ncbi:cyclin-dependent kinase G-2-like, partial [Solanum stenotomum]|uniref:cyclin-dependent kinase G-2-like n=1 Tax=Solanum stenotomum TaxID=172797 RepID=UPI0020D0C21B
NPVNMVQCCRSVEEFERLNKIGEGTYGVVYKAREKKTGEIVALKKLKISKKDEEEGFPLTFIREINILLTCRHPSIVYVKEVVVGATTTKLNNDVFYIVMEYLENDLQVLIEKMTRRFSQREVKSLLVQLLEGVKYLHDNWIIHRDLKTSNLLINDKGELKIADFGLARRIQSGHPLKPYTHEVVTLWYRSPELLIGMNKYSNAIDMWSIGCIMAELLTNKPIFDGKSEIDQINKIFGILGTPDEKIWPGFTKLCGLNKVKFVNKKHNYSLRKRFPSISFTDTVLSNSGFDLLNRFLTYDPNKRITAEAALKHAWFPFFRILFFVQKIALKLEVHDNKGKQKAMKAVSTLSGIETLSIDLKEKKLTVIGDVDLVQVVGKLKKILLHPEILVGPTKEPEKKEDG